MEFSKYLGVADDECSSSESGWTMYIVSPMHEPNHHNQNDHNGTYGVDYEKDYDGNQSNHGDGHCYDMHPNDDQDSDDSMVSDASSAPTPRGILRGIAKKRCGLGRESKHAVGQKQVEKKFPRVRAGKDEQKTRIEVKEKKAK